MSNRWYNSLIMRIFIAFPTSLKAKQELQIVQKQMQEIYNNLQIKWTKLENFHVTLEFFGELNEKQLDRIKSVLRFHINKYNTFLYCLKNIEFFFKKRHGKNPNCFSK